MRQCRPASRAFVVLRVSSVKHPIVNKDEPRMNTNGHEDRWTCLPATPSWDEGRERGRPARKTLAQPRSCLLPGSTGNGARTLLQLAPCRSRRQGGRAPHHGETERPPNAENAGETPALPEGRLLPSFLLREEALPLTMRQSRPASRAFVVLRVSSVKHPIVNKDEPRMNTNRHEDPWTCLAATTSREEGRERLSRGSWRIPLYFFCFRSGFRARSCQMTNSGGADYAGGGFHMVAPM